MQCRNCYFRVYRPGKPSAVRFQEFGKIFIMSHTLTRDPKQTIVDEQIQRRWLSWRWQGLTLAASLIFLSLHHHPLHAQSPTPDKSDSEKLTPASATLGQMPAAGSFNRPYGFYLNPILEHIHANSDQREKITSILASYKPIIEPLRVEYRSKNAELLSKIAHGDKPETIMDRAEAAIN